MQLPDGFQAGISPRRLLLGLPAAVTAAHGAVGGQYNGGDEAWGAPRLRMGPSGEPGAHRLLAVPARSSNCCDGEDQGCCAGEIWRMIVLVCTCGSVTAACNFSSKYLALVTVIHFRVMR